MQTELEIDLKPNTVAPIDRDQVATSAEIRTLSKRGGDNFIKFLYENIIVRPGHNGRTEKNPGFSVESLEELARSIFHLGLEDPLTIVILKNGKGLLIKGERRFRAIGIIRGWIKNGNMKELFAGGDIEKEIPSFDYIECFTSPKHYNEQDYIISMLAENMARVDLTPMEEAEGFLRARQSGMTAAQIARSVPNLSPMKVSLRLKLAGLSPAEKELIDEGKISHTAAVKLAGVVEDADERVGIINDAAEGENGKLKVSDLMERIADNEANENPGNLVDKEESTNPLRNGDLVDEIKSGADDDLSMKGTSPKHKPDARIDGDPAAKSVDQPEVLGDFDDEYLKSGTKTAFDLTLKVMAEIDEMKAILGYDADQRLKDLMVSMKKKLSDIKVILKLKKKK